MKKPIEELVASLAGRCADDDWVSIEGVGWLARRRYEVYAGRAPRTGEPRDAGYGYLPFFLLDPALGDALDGRLENESFADEQARLRHALSLASEGEANGEDESFAILRFVGGDVLGEEIRSALLERGIANVEGLGVFELVPKPDRRGVRFRTTEDFKRRIGDHS